MNSIFTLLVNIGIVLLISTVSLNLISGSKNERYVKNVVALLVLYLCISFILKFDFKSIGYKFDAFDSVDSDQSWADATVHIESELESMIYKLCIDNGIAIDSVSVNIKTDYSEFQIDSIDIVGDNAHAAKRLISSYFQLSSAYININGE